MKRRILAMMLSLAMTLSLLPTDTVRAENGTPAVTEDGEVQLDAGDDIDVSALEDLAVSAKASSDYTASWENVDGINNPDFNPTKSNGGTQQGWGNWGAPAADAGHWVQYTWNEAKTFNLFQIYWYDDNGGTRVPTAIRLQYLKDGGSASNEADWESFNMYADIDEVTAVNTYNKILTDTVTTKAVRMYLTMQAPGTGIYRWKVNKVPDAQSLEIVSAMMKLPSEVVEDFALPSNVAGVEVTWASNKDAIKVENGKAVVTTSQEQDEVVELTATLKSGETTKEVKYQVTVKKVNLTEFANSIQVPATATESFNLTTSFAGGVTVAWSSDNDAIRIENGRAEVIRDLTTRTVNLTATLSKKGCVDVEKTFPVSVTAMDMDAMIEKIKVPATASMDFQLKTNLGNGISVAWTSSDNNVISIDTSQEKALSKVDGTLNGVVPVAVSYAQLHRGAQEKNVTLTATITKQGTTFTETKTFPVKVEKSTGRDVASAVDFTKVHIEDDFWKARQKAFICKTIPVGIEKVEDKEGGVDNLIMASKLNKGDATKDDALFEGSVYFLDSDPYKMIEAMSFALQIPANGDEDIVKGQQLIDTTINKWIGYIEGAQEESGYLDTYFTLDHSKSNAYPNETHDKWTNFALHEMYCNGHFYEAVAAYTRAKGYEDTRLLDVAVKNADLHYATFGINDEQRKACPGHEEIELALVKLAAVCEEMGDAKAPDGVTYASKAKKYIRLAQFFLSVRGQDDDERYGYNSYTGNFHDEYDQEDCEVTDITDPVGHAVRCMYLYTGMTDVAILEDTSIYDTALLTVWDNLTNKKSYVTGGIGSSAANEGFGADYELPNETAYAESCANIGSFIWNSRMNQLYGDSKYADVMERTLYNSIISCVNFDGDKFFYGNPHATNGGSGRSAWFGCACCPPNLMRLVESLGSYVYTQKGDVITMNLYVGNNADLTVDGKALKFNVETEML